ncbi:hypothetical protein [Frankia sp. AiPa1]|uniref:hypothetical protein n=1 Tax=Frankia sp. AiPa1 TaxID=573492 RepID=UPI00202B2CDE|nr:hypothetical protein [Frankia sp. AiPa1]MCL9759300.1 hypothetical protein [Frankia sp. AiPa1]
MTTAGSCRFNAVSSALGHVGVDVGRCRAATVRRRARLQATVATVRNRYARPLCGSICVQRAATRR